MYKFSDSKDEHKKISKKLTLMKADYLSQPVLKIWQKLISYYNKTEVKQLSAEKLNLFWEFSQKYTKQLMNNPYIIEDDIDPVHFMNECSKFLKEKFGINLYDEDRQFLFQYVNNRLKSDHIYGEFMLFIRHKNQLEKVTFRKPFKEFEQLVNNFFSKFSDEYIIYTIVATTLFFQQIGFRDNEISRTQSNASKIDECTNSSEVNPIFNLVSWFAEALIGKYLCLGAVKLIDKCYIKFTRNGFGMSDCQRLMEYGIAQLSEDLFHHINGIFAIHMEELAEELEEERNSFFAHNINNEQGKFVTLVKRQQDESKTFNDSLCGFSH